MPEKSSVLRLRVYRYLNNRPGEPAPDSAEGLELHRRRATALHSLFDEDTTLRVVDWGDTDTEKSHEYVDLLLELISRPEVQQSLNSATEFARDVLANATGDLVAATVGYLIGKFRRPQKEGKVQEVEVYVDKARIVMTPQLDGRTQISIEPTNQPSIKLDADANAGQVRKLRTEAGLVKKAKKRRHKEKSA